MTIRAIACKKNIFATCFYHYYDNKKNQSKQDATVILEHFLPAAKLIDALSCANRLHNHQSSFREREKMLKGDKNEEIFFQSSQLINRSSLSNQLYNRI